MDLITKQEFLDSVLQETRIIKHLALKLTQDHLDYKPTATQRTMLELLQYLSVCAIGPAINIMTGNWEHMKELIEQAKNVNLDNFTTAMDRQYEQIKNLLKERTEADLSQKDATMPWGAPLKAGAALINMPLKCLVAYRMQLFLYAKASGLSNIGPANCWAGVDAPK
jgi:hypothetical protein